MKQIFHHHSRTLSQRRQNLWILDLVYRSGVPENLIDFLGLGFGLISHVLIIIIGAEIMKSIVIQKI